MVERVHPDPVLAAINRHQSAYDAFQIAPEGEDSVLAQDEMLDARSELLSTSCATLAGCFALVEHLRWFLVEEAENYGDHDSEWRQIKGREAELAMLLGSRLPPHRPALAHPEGAPPHGR